MTTVDTAKKEPKDWHRAEIICALRKAGYSLRSLSTEAGYAAGTAGQALCRSYPAMEKLIAEKIGVEPSIIWPSRYKDGATK